MYQGSLSFLLDGEAERTSATPSRATLLAYKDLFEAINAAS